LILVSASYASRVWTTHERRSAQARALEQKSEYILPVRFDDTEIPGLPSTVAYLKFQDYGPAGICNQILQKLGNMPGAPIEPIRPLSTSPRACILDPEQSLQAYIPVVECTWARQEATLMLQPDDPSDGPFLDALRDSRRSVYVAFKGNLGLCRVEDVLHVLKGGQDRWEVRLRIEESDFTPTMEMGMQGLTADDLAERRARRILLDEYRYVEGKGRSAGILNEAAMEVFVRGVNAPFQPKASPLPPLYERYGREPMKFLEIAWIVSVLLLKTTGVVVEITTLKLALNGERLDVTFAGKRRKQYTNRPAASLAFSGVCNLTKADPS
jgi:hypothetical protein